MSPIVWLLFLVSFVNALALLPATACAKDLQVVVLTDAAGLGDKGFNDVCWQGVQRAARDFGLSTRFLQSREQADYVANLTLAAQNADVIVTLGYLFVDALKTVVPRFPKSRFIHIEGDIPGENIASYDFNSEEGGFLAGLVAGLFTKSRKVGAITGMDIPPVEAYTAGFMAGLKAAGIRQGPIEPIIVSAGSFNDPVKGKSLARTLMDRGVDVIFKAAGNTGVGVIEAIKESETVHLIAEDLDQDGLLPGKILASALKRMDVAVYVAIQGVVQDAFRGGHRWLGAVDGAVDLTEMTYSKQLFAPEDFERIQKARNLLKEGKLIIPKRTSEIEGFRPPEL